VVRTKVDDLTTASRMVLIRALRNHALKRYGSRKKLTKVRNFSKSALISGELGTGRYMGDLRPASRGSLALEVSWSPAWVGTWGTSRPASQGSLGSFFHEPYLSNAWILRALISTIRLAVVRSSTLDRTTRSARRQLGFYMHRISPTPWS
jgi:hypothetical protein